MEQNQNYNSQNHKDSQNSENFSSAPNLSQLQFNPDFGNQHANPFLDTPLMEVSDEPEEMQAPVRRPVLPIITGIIFYVLLAGFIFLSWKHIQNKVSDLPQQLEVYEQSQAPHFAQILFEEHFASPDWGALYDAAASEMLTQYEGRNAYVRYMKNKAGNEPLTYQYRKTLSENEIEYSVYLKKEQIAAFTMVNTSSDPAAPQWEMGRIKILYTNDQSYRIESSIGHTVKVNGIALNETSIVKSTQLLPTSALKILANQFPVIGTNIHEIQGLMAKPFITIEDGEGNVLDVSYNEETHVFSESLAQQAPPQEIQDLALNAVRTYSKFMVRQSNTSELNQYFKPGTDTHKAITSSRQDHLQKPESCTFKDEQVSNLVYYADDFYSVDVSLTLQMPRPDGTIKEDLVEKSLFFQQQSNGSWICTNMTSEELYDEVTTVRVKFIQDDNVLFSRMVNQKDTVIYCPDAVTPTELADNGPSHILKKEEDSQLEKIVFAGWGIKLMDPNGKPFYQPVFQVGLDRKAEIPGGLLDEPVTLYPIFVWEKVK